MPLLASNFTSNSLQGTVSVENGFANVNLQVEPFALEGNKSFVIKLRKDSFSGTVLSTSAPITITDNSTIATVTANISSVAEGNLVQFTVTTTNVINNANLFFSVLPRSANITFADFTANIGMVTIVNNTGTFTLRANADLSLMDETDETFAVQMRTNSPTGNIVFSNLSNVTILDVSKGFNILSFVESAATVGEGTPITLTFNATNIPTGTLFFWNTEGNATVSTFAGGNTGSFVMNSFSNTITLNPTGVTYSTTQNFNVKLRAHSNTGAVVATSNNLIVIDSAIAYITATGGNVATISGYKVHTFNTSGVLNVTGLGATGQLEILSVAGGGSGGGDTGSSSGGSGGGAGGYVYTPSVSAILGNITVTIGGGGANPGASNAANGGNTSITGANFANILSVGGGKGGFDQNPGAANFPGGNGGSGGGAGYFSVSAGSGYDYPGPTQQGYPGGSSVITPSPFTWTTNTGGGGAGAAGSSGNFSGGSSPAGNGGIGIQSNISGFSAYYAGGGGGGYGEAGDFPKRGLGGNGGGGAGGSAGIVNTGGGGGGGGPAVAGYSGGSGVVIIRYPYVAPLIVSNVVTSSNVFTFGSNITFTVNAQNANLITLYYSTDGNVIASNFINGNTGSFVANASGGIVTLQSNSSVTILKEFRLQIRQDSTTGFISGSSANVILINSADYYMQATGGNISIANGYKTHTFTVSGNLNVTGLGFTSSASNAEILVVAGGGGGGIAAGGGGGGGLLYGNINLSLQNYTVIIGGGGSTDPAGVIPGLGPSAYGLRGGNTTLSPSIVAIGGGGGAGQYGGLFQSGGSGAGGSASFGTHSVAGLQGPSGGLTGYKGNGAGSNPAAGGGGGGGGAGGNGASAPPINGYAQPGAGGAGFSTSISGSPVVYSAGGRGMLFNTDPGSPSRGNPSPVSSISPLAQNIGAGGTSGGNDSQPGSPGIVIIRYPYS